MEIKFETIGNASLIVYEKNIPIIASDVWLDSEDAYFGSWVLSHKIPKNQTTNNFINFFLSISRRIKKISNIIKF